MLAPGVIELHVDNETNKANQVTDEFANSDLIAPYLNMNLGGLPKERKTAQLDLINIGNTMKEMYSPTVKKTAELVAAFVKPEKGIEAVNQHLTDEVPGSEMDRLMKMDAVSLHKDLTDPKKQVLKCVRQKAKEDAAIKQQKEQLEKAKSFEMNKNKNLSTNEKTFD